MNKIGTTIAALAATALLLTGCSAAEPAAPLDEGSIAYLEAVKPIWIGDVPSDEELLAYAEQVCDEKTDNIIRVKPILPGSTSEPVNVDSSTVDKNNYFVLAWANVTCD